MNAAYRRLPMEANINDNSRLDIFGKSDPPDSGFDYNRLDIHPKKPGFYK